MNYKRNSAAGKITLCVDSVYYTANLAGVGNDSCNRASAAIV